MLLDVCRQLLTRPEGVTVTASQLLLAVLCINHSKPVVTGMQLKGLAGFCCRHGTPRALKPITPPTCGVPPPTKVSSALVDPGPVAWKTTEPEVVTVGSDGET